MKKSKPSVDVHCVLTEDNITEFKDLLAFWRDKVDNVSAEYAHNWGDQKSSGFKPVNFLNTIRPFKYPCEMLWSSLFILWNGDVSICCVDFNGDVLLGDLKKNSIQEVWNSPKYKSYRRTHYNRRFSRIPLCSECLVNTNPFSWRGI